MAIVLSCLRLIGAVINGYLPFILISLVLARPGKRWPEQSGPARVDHRAYMP